MIRNLLQGFRSMGIAAVLLGGVSIVNAQASADSGDPGLPIGFTVALLIAGLSVGGAIIMWRRTKVSVVAAKSSPSVKSDAAESTNGSSNGLNAEKDLEWLRKVKERSPRISFGAKTQTATAARKWKEDKAEEETLDTKMFQEKMRRMQYTQLPINSFSHLAPAKKFQPLPISDDTSLLTAIEQTDEEYEDDETVREVALRILTAFKTKNSVEALSQIALYDLSSNLRSKAVTTLADFDHESVFEAILLAWADPTREVRAAAARGLFKLSFDRAHAWTRIIETADKFRMTQAARAAIEAGIVVKTFDRLVHEDVKIAYEAFALITLLIRAGETEEILDAIKNHKDERVKFALLHVLKVTRDEHTLEKINELRVQNSFPTEIADRLREVALSLERIPVQF